MQLEARMAPVDQRLAERDLKRLQDDIRAVMSTPQGRGLLSALFMTYGLRNNVFSPNGSEMAFKAGKQFAAKWLFDQIVDAQCYDLYQVMEKEAMTRDEEIQKERALLLQKFNKEGKL